MGEVVDFLADVPWESWETDAETARMLFIERALRQGSNLLFDKFEFRMWTERADYFALDLWKIANERVAVEIKRGPLGGGKFYVGVEPVNGFIATLEMGKPVRFLLTLTGPPVGKKAIERLCRR